MKRNYVYGFALVWALVLSGCVAAFAQFKTRSGGGTIAAEVRPFDFSDKTYYANGVEPSGVVKRRDGADGHSVFDYISDPRYRGVRIQSVFPAYDQFGKPVFGNYYGEVHKEGFLNDIDGAEALRRAHAFPLYMFPSAKDATAFRQAHLVNLRDSYFEKNPLGLSVQVLIEYTDRIDTIEGQKEMQILAERNGVSADGTPIIKTMLEIEELTQKSLVTQKIKSLVAPGEPAYAVARIIEKPERGAIAGDAFLVNDLGLAAEENFVREFRCLQSLGRWCARF